MPHITLVSGYLLPFFEWNLWGKLSTTVVVLVAIVVWMVFAASLLLYLTHRQGFGAETRAYLPVLGLVALAILFLLPNRLPTTGQS